MISLLRRFDSAVAVVEAWLLTALVLMMTLVAVVQVVLRNLFPSQALSWADVAVRHGVFWVGFIGASLAASKGKHLAIDVLSHILKGPAKLAMARITDVLASVVAWILAWQAWRFVQIEGDKTYLILPFGFALVGLRFFLRALALEEEK